MPSLSDFFSKPFRSLERALVPENQLAQKGIQIGLGAIPGFGPALATGFGALSASKDVPEGAGFGGALPVAMGGLGGYGMGSLGAGAANWLQPGGTSFMTDFGAGMGNYFNAPGAGGLWGAGGKAADFLGGLGGGGRQVASAMGQPVGFGQTIQGAPGGNWLGGMFTGGGGGGGRGIMPGEWDWMKGLMGQGGAGGQGGFNPMSLLPAGISAMGLLGSRSPEMPAYPQTPMPSQYGLAGETYENLLGELGSQDFMSPIQDYLNLQEEQAMKGLRTQAGRQGWLDSTQFTERAGDIGREYDVMGGLSMADLAKWGIGERGNIAGQMTGLGGNIANLQQQNLLGPYAAQMGRYGTDVANRQGLLGNLTSQLGDIFNPNPMDEYMRRILGG